MVFSRNFMIDIEVTENIQTRIVSLGIVDREHTWHSVTDLLLEDSDRGQGFQWPVTRLGSSPDISVFLQLTRSINGSHQGNVFIETTIYDKLHGMQQKYERMRDL